MSAELLPARRATGSRRPFGEALRAPFAGPILGPIFGFVAAAIVPTGPWLVSVLALSVISLTLTPALGAGAIENIRLAVVYALALALIATAPIAAVAARLARGAAEAGDVGLARDLYAACLIGAGFLSQALALVVALGVGGMGLEMAAAFVTLTAAGSLLWTSFAMLSALRRQWRVIAAFSAGTGIAVGCALLGVSAAPRAELLLWSFALGLSISHQLMFAAVATPGDVALAGLRRAAAAIWGECRRRRLLFFGILFGMAGVWADKSVFWFGPSGMTAASGLPHFAPYDSAMFIAHLSMVPTLAAWYQFQQGALEPRVQGFWRLIGERPTYDRLAAEAAGLQDLVWTNVTRILFVQAACTALMVMLAPQIVRALGLRPDQIELIQIGAVAVLLQSLFFLCSALLMICNRERIFLRLNVGFFASMLGLGIVCQWLFGVNAYAAFLASLFAAAASFVLAYRALGDFLFTVFVRENEGLHAEPEPGALARRIVQALVARRPPRLSGG